MNIYRNPQAHDMVFIDSSAIDHIRDKPELNYFFETKKVMAFRSPSIENELSHSNTPESSKTPFQGIKWFTCETTLCPENEEIKEGIRNIMQGNATSKDHTNDALHIFYAAESYGYLIAVDKRIIAKRNEIFNYLHEQKYRASTHIQDKFILTPEEFMSISL